MLSTSVTREFVYCGPRRDWPNSYLGSIGSPYDPQHVRRVGTLGYASGQLVALLVFSSFESYMLAVEEDQLMSLRLSLITRVVLEGGRGTSSTVGVWSSMLHSPSALAPADAPFSE